MREPAVCIVQVLGAAREGIFGERPALDLVKYAVGGGARRRDPARRRPYQLRTSSVEHPGLGARRHGRFAPRHPTGKKGEPTGLGGQLHRPGHSYRVV